MIPCPTARSIKKWAAPGLFASIFFFFAGQLFIPLLGIQNDEAIFASPLYEPLAALYSWRFGAYQIPLMLMTYLGCVKTLIYAPIFKLFHTGVYAVREPALVFGALSVWLFFLLLRRVSGSLAATIGCWLLASDSLYLLTTCYDWGPVALQHLLLVAGLLALVRFYQSRSNIWLASGCLLLGLALWDKALALWSLSGFGIAALALYPRQILAVANLRRILLSAAALALGALPLISYNAHSGLATIRENTSFDTSSLIAKISFLAETAEGGALLGFWNAPDQLTPIPHQPHGLIGRISAGISSLAGHPSSDGLLAALALAVLIAPFAGWPTLRAVLFFLVAMAVAWFEMAVNPHAGATVHHTILLWPWPQAVIAISFAGASQRLGRFGAPAAAAVTALVALSCLLVTNEYLTRIARNGGSPTWSPAIFRLAASVKDSHAAHVFCTDWGILDSLTLLDRNHPPMRDGMGLVADAAALKWALGDPSNLFAGHVREAEVDAGVNEKLIDQARALGHKLAPIEVIGDGYGRNVFTLYRFE